MFATETGIFKPARRPLDAATIREIEKAKHRARLILELSEIEPARALIATLPASNLRSCA